MDDAVIDEGIGIGVMMTGVGVGVVTITGAGKATGNGTLFTSNGSILNVLNMTFSGDKNRHLNNLEAMSFIVTDCPSAGGLIKTKDLVHVCIPT